MKKYLTILCAVGLLMLPIMAIAVDYSPPGGSINSIESVMNGIITPVWEFFVGMSVIMFVVAGILFLTANGDPGKLGTARQALIWGVVGIVVAILAFSILAIIKTAVGGS